MRDIRSFAVVLGCLWALEAMAQTPLPPGTLTPVAGFSLKSDLIYPMGQAPSWDGVGPNVLFTDVVVRNAQGAERPDKRAYYLTSIDGKPGFVFEYADGAACAFDVANPPAEPLAPGASVTLSLVNSRLHTVQNFAKEVAKFDNAVEEAINAPGWRDLVAGPPTQLTPGSACGLGLLAAGRWNGTLTVTAGEKNGDFSIQGQINQLGRADAIKQSVTFGPIALPNKQLPMSPREMLALQTERGTLGDAVLPIMDPTPLPQRVMTGSRIGVQMQSIDDIGFVFLANQVDKDLKLAALAEWSAPQNFGYASADLGPMLRPGRNLVILGLHNKAFAYGVGKWSYAFTLTLDGQPVWQANKGMRAPGVGLRFWKIFLAEKDRNGRISLSSLTAEEAERVESLMGGINNTLVNNFAVEQSSQALMTSAIISAFSTGSGSASGSGQSYYEYERRDGYTSSAPPSRPDTSLGCSWGDRAYGTC